LPLTAVAAACTGSSPRTTAPTTTKTTTTAPRAAACAKPHTQGQSSQTITFQGQPRTYQLFVPRRYDGRTPVPVVFNFHGFGSGSVQQMLYGDFRPLAERDDFIIVAPDGQGTTSRHFNIGTEPGLQNDVLLVGALLD